MRLFLAQEFHDIAPPVEYSLIPPWLVFVGSFLALAAVGLIGWLVWRWLRKPKQRFLGKSPMELLGTEAGARLVEEMLYQLAYGIFA